MDGINRWKLVARKGLVLDFRGIWKRGAKRGLDGERERERERRSEIARTSKRTERSGREKRRGYALHAKYKRRDGWWMAWRGAARCMPTPSCMEQSFALVLPTEGSLAPPPVAGCT